MGVNKVTLNTPNGEEVAMDISNDTVTAETLLDGETAHGADGEEVVGTLKPVLYTPQELTDEQKAQARENIGAAQATASGGISAIGTFIDNADVDYLFDDATGAYYTVIRVYKKKLDGTQQFPFVYAPNGTSPGNKSTYDLVYSDGWALAINAGVFDSNTIPDGIVIQDNTVINSGATQTHSANKPLTIDANGDLSYAAYDADANNLVNSGIVSAVCGFMPIIVDYEAVPSAEWNNVDHYTENAQRQIIGQWGNGDYAIITCEGRGFHNSDGWTIAEAQTVCRKHGLKFAYNLDGGGSTETMLGLKNINTIYENATGRKVPTFIVFDGGTMPPAAGIRNDLPAEYKQLRYIEMTGTQYIITDVVGSLSDAGIEFHVDAVIQFNTPNGKRDLFGGNPCWYFGVAATGVYEYANSKSNIRPSGGFDHIKMSAVTNANFSYSGDLWVNGEHAVTGGSSDYTYSVSTKFVIGSLGNSNGIYGTQFNASAKVKSLSISKGGTAVGDYIPCQRVADGAVGLYDFISAKFYTNDGTGEFIYA